MLLKALEIEELYYTFSYKINFDKDPNLYVLTGLNGYGKTTILRILASLSKSDDLYYFYTIPFKRILVVFDNGIKLIISKIKNSSLDNDDDIATNEKQTTVFKLSRGKRLISKFEIDRKSFEGSEYYQNSLNKQNDQESDYRYIFFDTSKPKKKNEIIERFSMNLSILNTTFISSQRLYREDNKGKSHYVIHDMNQSMSRFLKRAYFDYLSTSQELDSHQIDLLLNDDVNIISEKEFTEKADNIQQLVKELRSYNLLPAMTVRPYNKDKPLISSVYLNTLEQKLHVYDDIRRRLRLFFNLLNEKKFVNKSFVVSRESGFQVHLNKGGILDDLNNLSSGEQNEIYLLFKLIFEVPSKSLLLIDEPELSLHVAWQLQFIKDIKEIAKIRDIQIIIATHSPEIVSESIDNCIDLTEINKSK